jgi:predicted nucleotidyltransferase
LQPARLGELCLGGPVSEADVRWAATGSRRLAIVHELVLESERAEQAARILDRASGHGAHAGEYIAMTQRFVRTLVEYAPFIRSVWIAGSLASGGFRESDDVDLNLVVDDGHRHLAYVAVNVLGVLHALGHRSKPVDDLTRRPVAPRLMTANLILERSQLAPLARQDEGMAFELMVSEPVYGADVFREIVDRNPALLDHFPQLAAKQAPLAIHPAPHARVPRWLYPATMDGAARAIGQAAWRYMQWTRRNRPDALARVAFVRETMRPYTLFDDAWGD